MFTITLNLQGGKVHKANIANKGGWAVLYNPNDINDTSLGVHIYSTNKNGLLECTLRVNNGVIPNFCGAVYFNSLIVEHDTLKFITLPSLSGNSSGKTWNVISNGNHLFRPRQIYEARFVCYPSADKRSDANKLLRLTYVDFPNQVTNYGPTYSKLPKVKSLTYTGFRNVLNSVQLSKTFGTPYYYSPFINLRSIGPYLVNGADTGGEPGGFGINTTASIGEQTYEGLFTHYLVHEANVNRSFVACYDRTGNPVSIYNSKLTQSLINGEPNLPIQWHTELDPFLEGDYYNRRYKRYNTGVCAYEQALWNLERYWTSHAIRLYGDATFVAEIANLDSVKDDIWMFAEDGRQFDWSDRTDELTVANTPPGTWIPPSLSAKVAEVNKTPHKGSSDIYRSFCWMSFGGMLCRKYQRGNWDNWGLSMIQLIQNSYDKFGFSQRDVLNGSPAPSNVKGIQTFHQGLVLIGLFCLGKSLNVDVSNVMKLACNSMYNTLSVRPYSGVVGPPHWIGTEDNGQELRKLDEVHAYGEGDPAHVLAVLALTYRLTQDKSFLTMSLKHWVPHSNLNDRLIWLQQNPDKTWGGEMETVLQELKDNNQL